MIASATSTGGLAVIVINKFRAKNIARASGQNTKEGRTDHEQETDRASESRIAS
jgi:hypothetical protein